MKKPSAAVFVLALAYLLLRAPDPLLLLENNDQGYQMALGMSVANGRIPCLDVLTQYGPGVAVASWLGFILSGSAVGELCIDAVGYAAAIALAYRIARWQTNGAFAMLGVIALLALFPRFYKWYYWLLPLISLSMAERFRAAVAANGPVVLKLAFWGLSIGGAWLFRYDLGLEGVVFGLLSILAAYWSVRTDLDWRWRAACRDGVTFLLMCAMLPGMLLGLIAVARGREQLALFLLSVQDGATDTVQAYGIRPFIFDPGELLSAANVLALLQLAFLAVYAAALGISLRELASSHESNRQAGFRLLCVTLTGIGVLPQALHRADLQHLLQVAPPFVLVLISLAARFACAFGDLGWQRRSLGIAVCAVMSVLLVAAVPGASTDLAPGWRNPAQYWRTIANLPESMATDPVADMAVAIRRLTLPNSTLFLMMATSRMPLLFFAERSQAGLFPVNEVGMFAGQVWLAHNRAALLEAPPDYLIVPQPGTVDDVGEPAPFMPDLAANWLRHYTRELHANSRYRLLAPN